MPYATVFYAAVDPQFFETLDRYEPSRELWDLVEDVCCHGWDLEKGGFWSMCAPNTYKFKVQGWKLHVAGTAATAENLLRRLLPIFVEEGVAFKFCSDLSMVKLSTSKNWSRTAAGKFITVYPTNTQQFMRLADRCHCATQDLSGPYILTDRPYCNSRVIFYRYGGHIATFMADPDGLRVPVIFAPDGKEFPDRRVPFFQIPPWAEDPFSQIQTEAFDESKEIALGDGRYHINRAIRFSSCGGIYRAIDKKTEAPVIIREQRPMIGNGEEGLEKEARILQKLAGTAIAPAFLDLFRAGGHSFLVQEFLAADSLWTRMMSFTFGKENPTTPEELFQNIRQTIRKIIAALEIVHGREVVLRDLTKTNVLLTPHDGDVKFIDFELAYEMDRDDPPVVGSTLGYGSPQQLNNEVPKPSDDYYALGALMIDTIAVTASGLGLNRSGILEAVRRTVDDFGLPRDLFDVAEGLLQPDAAHRINPSKAMNILDSAQIPIVSRTLDPQVLPNFRHCPPRDPPDKSLVDSIDHTLQGITQYILATADHSRRDRLWPASSEVFLTNPVCIRFGASGVAYYLLRVAHAVPQPIIDWIHSTLGLACCPGGLYNGISGIAILLLSLGRISEARKIFEQSINREHVCKVPGLYEGAAGWGLANLHFWRATGDGLFLGRAIEAAEQLASTANTDGDGAYWVSGGRVPLGLGSGPSGIALFLTYLGVAENESKWIDLAKSAVNFELAQASWLGDRVFLHEFKTNDSKKAKSPHTKYGSAGAATSVLRLHAVTGDSRYRHFAEKCAYTVSTRVTNKLWQDWGLAGFGEFLIDAYCFLGDQNYLNTAYYLAEALLDYRMLRPEGIAFPGEDLLRISCDYGLGSAGIGMFLHRLQNPHLPRFLLLDDLLLSTDSNSVRYQNKEPTGAAERSRW